MSKCVCIAPVFLDRVNVQSDSSNAGDNDPSYTTTIEGMPCTIRTVNGDETYKGRQLSAHLTHVLETPYRTGLTPTMRLSVAGGIYNAQILNIESVRPVRKPNGLPFLELYCKELVN